MKSNPFQAPEGVNVMTHFVAGDPRDKVCVARQGRKNDVAGAVSVGFFISPFSHLLAPPRSTSLSNPFHRPFLCVCVCVAISA